MAPSIWTFIVPAALGLGGVVFTALTAKRKNNGDLSMQMLTVVMRERDSAERDAKRWEDYAWKLWRLLQGAGVEAPAWPSTDEQPKVAAK